MAVSTDLGSFAQILYFYSNGSQSYLRWSKSAPPPVLPAFVKKGEITYRSESLERELLTGWGCPWSL
jgi:hypothetical protein